METENLQDNWVRRRFKGNKVWVETDGGENPLVLDGRVRIKYRLDQEYEYRVYPEAIRPLDEPLSGTTQSRAVAGATKKRRPKATMPYPSIQTGPLRATRGPRALAW